MPEDQQQQQQRRPDGNSPWDKQGQGPFEGPRAPNVSKPDTEKILKNLRRVAPDQAKRYKQRAGE